MLNDESFTKTNSNDSFYKEDMEMVIPVMEEFVSVSKRKAETALITVTKKVSERTELIDVALQNEAYDIEYVEFNQYIDEDNIPVTRQEENTLILPVVKEVIVKRMMLVEEVRITKKITQASAPQHVTLRSETVDVKRTPVTEE